MIPTCCRYGGAGTGELVYPPSHALTQTDREYFNLVRTEDGHSGYLRQRGGGRGGAQRSNQTTSNG